MSQQEILDLLEEEDRWMETIEIMKKTQGNRASTLSSLNKLFKQELIIKIEPNKKNHPPGSVCYKWRKK